MKIISIYRVLTYLLAPFALLLLLTSFPMLIAVLANPTALLPFFMIACIIIYIYCSFKFLNKGIKQQQLCKKTLKDWIKVNAYVCIAFVVLMLVQGSVIASNPSLISQQLFDDISKQNNGNLPPQFSLGLMIKMLKYVTYFMLFYAVVLGAHIVLSFRLLKSHQHLFEGE